MLFLEVVGKHITKVFGPAYLTGNGENGNEGVHIQGLMESLVEGKHGVASLPWGREASKYEMFKVKRSIQLLY